MLKVLHCIPGMGGGGGERQLAYLASPLRALGWQVHVALTAGGPNLERLQAGGAALHWIGGVGHHDPRLVWRLARVVRDVHPDVVQVWFVQMEVLGAIVAELFRIPWVLSERSSGRAYPPTWKNRARIHVARMADAIIANSAGGDRYWETHLGARVPRFVIANAVPFDEIDAAAAAVPAPLSIGRDQSVVLFAGRFDGEKNIDGVVAALSALVARRPATTAVLCGDGPVRHEVQRRVAARGLADRILMPGYLDQIWPLMKRADAVMSVGHFEGRPNAVIEAMALGRPLVVSDIAAHREILDDDSAFWVQPADAAGVAAALAFVLDNPADAHRRAVAARGRAAAWSVAAVAAQYDRVYREILAHRP